jgi:hypothetical protein
LFAWIVLYFLLITLLFKNKGLKTFAYFGIFLFSALRYEVGYDYEAYYRIIKTGELLDTLKNEYFSFLLLKTSNILGFEQLFFIFTSVLILLPLIYTTKKYSYREGISMIMFFTFPLFFFNSLSIVRQFVAISITLLTIKEVKERNFLKFLIIIITAFLFHNSALIFLPIYFLYTLKIKNIFYIIIFLVASSLKPILLTVSKFLFPEYYISYIKNIGDQTGGNISFYIIFALFFIIIIFRKKIIKNKIHNYFLNNLFFGIILYYLLLDYGHAWRISLYFIIYVIYLLPNLFLLYKKEIKYLLYILFIGFATFNFFYTLYLGHINPNKNPFIPYELFFW